MTKGVEMYLEYSESGHKYYADAVEFPSVTTILRDAGKISSFSFDEQRRWEGNVVHDWTALDDQALVSLLKIPKELRGYARAWRAYKRESGFMPTEIEKRVDCLTHQYSGRFDRLGTLPGIALSVILDIKTAKSGAIAPYVRLQLSAYGFALDSKKIFYRTAVSLKPDGSYKVRNYPTLDYQSDVAEFLKLAENHKGENNAQH